MMAVGVASPSAQGQAIRFPVGILPVRSRTAGSVKGLRLKPGDTVIGMEIVESETVVLFLSKHGHGKRTRLRNFPIHNRGGQGIRAFNINNKTGPLATLKVVPPDCEEIMVGSARAQVIRIEVAQIPILGRVTQGVILWRPGEGDQVVSVACMSNEEPAKPVAPQKGKPVPAVNGDAPSRSAKNSSGVPKGKAQTEVSPSDDMPDNSTEPDAADIPRQGMLPLAQEEDQSDIAEFEDNVEDS